VCPVGLTDLSLNTLPEGVLSNPPALTLERNVHPQRLSVGPIEFSDRYFGRALDRLADELRPVAPGEPGTDLVTEPLAELLAFAVDVTSSVLGALLEPSPDVPSDALSKSPNYDICRTHDIVCQKGHLPHCVVPTGIPNINGCTSILTATSSSTAALASHWAEP
jgi:hypothetical protein